MYLKDLIELLEKYDADKTVAVGFGNPHSYRGYYDQLAFEPVENTTVGEMLFAAKSAMGTTYQGWKGGDFTMGEWTPCWLAWEGRTSDERLSRIAVEAILGLPPTMPEQV